jgi:hypothetical protein
MPADFAWTDDPKTSQALVAALVNDPAGAVRDPVAAKLRVGIALGVRRTPDSSESALAALRADVSSFYQREMQGGDRCKAYIVERSPGVSRSLARGGAKYHQALLKAFAGHLLGVDIDAQRLMPPTLDLSVLRLGFDVSQAKVDGFKVVQSRFSRS